ncbi:MAG: hypothetical protein ACLUNZ_11920 [Evtepia sp.]
MVLHVLMTEGLRAQLHGADAGQDGFVCHKNHAHAEKILQIFGEEYPQPARLRQSHRQLYDLCPERHRRIFRGGQAAAYRHLCGQVLDTGIDVPEILNLVFFKPVMSKAKFPADDRGGGRGSVRACWDGEDKTGFRIFDFCGNFWPLFRSPEQRASPPPTACYSCQGAIFGLESADRLEITGLRLPDRGTHRTSRRRLVEEMAAKVRELNRDNFAVKQHLRFVEQYKDERTYDILTEEKLNQLLAELTPLILPDEDEVSASAV